MDVRLLKFFVAAYEQKNLTRAAKQCFVSQPNISNGIKQLEETIGKTLFVRHKRGIGIKKEADYLYPIAKRLLGELENLPTLFGRETFQHKVAIGVSESLPQEHKQQFFRKINALCTSVEWLVKPIGRTCDLNLLVREWKNEEELFLPLWKEDYVLCIPNGHHLLQKEVLDIEDIVQENFIHCPPCEAHRQCLSILGNGERPIHTIAHCSSKTETLTLLMAGMGITFLPEGFADGWYGFETRPYNGPKYFREVGLAYTRNSLNNPVVATIIEHFSKEELSINKFDTLGQYWNGKA